MNIVRIKKPRTEFAPFFSAIDGFLSRPFDELAFNQGGQSYRPLANVVEESDHFAIDINAPGLNKGDFKLNIEKDTLTITGEAQKSTEENKPNYTRREFSLHSFSRSFILPESIDTDNIQANYENGILKIRLPKLPEAQEKPVRTIEVA
jgi:HSP20 family protein